MPLNSGSIKSIALNCQGIQMTLVSQLVGTAHLHILQLFAGLSQTGRCSVILDPTVFQVVEPLLNGRCCHIVELIDPDQIVLWEHLLWRLHPNDIILLDIHLQGVASMHTYKGVTSVVEIIGSLPQIEVKDINGIDFLHIAVALPQ